MTPHFEQTSPIQNGQGKLFAASEFAPVLRVATKTISPGLSLAAATPGPSAPPAKGKKFNLEGLEGILPAPGAVPLTAQQKVEIWNWAVDIYDSETLNGRAPGEVVRQIVNCLWQRAPFLSKSTPALERQVYRKVLRVAEKGQAVDLRAEANRQKRAPTLSESDRDIFVHSFVYETYGELDLAWGKCIKEKRFSPELLAKYPVKANQRPRCPKVVRKQFSKQIVKRLLDLEHRPRKARQSGPYINNCHKDYFAGDWRTSDDFTLELYYATEPGDPTPLRRGQFLPEADCRSKRILSFILIDAEGYRQDEIRLLWKKTSQEFGLPSKGWHVENGIWKRGKLLGGKTCDSDDEIKQNFAERLGLRIVNSLPASPRGKIIENIGKLLQRYIRGEYRWVGPDEKRYKFERSQAAIQDVLSGRKTALEAGFMTRQGWFEKLRDEIIPEYNAAEQDSKVMGGDKIVRMSPDRAWEEIQPRDSNEEIVGVEYLPESLHWLFAHREVRKVGRNGIHLPYCGGLNYKGGDSGKFLGQNVIVYFDPENLESIVISDLKKENFEAVPRDEMIPRWTATREQISDAYARSRDHDAYPRMLLASVKSTFKPPARQIVSDAESRVRGQKIAESKTRLDQQVNLRNKRFEDAAVEEYRSRLVRADQYEGEHWYEMGMPGPPEDPKTNATIVRNFIQGKGE